VQFGIILSFMVVKSSLEKTLTNSDDLADRPNKTFAKPIETFFELSVVSTPFSSKKQSYDRT